MLHKKRGMPLEGEVVFCTVTKVQFHSVFANLDEYDHKHGMIHISEISPGRIRNINDYVKVGKVIVCKILKINKERGHIDLSLRRVNESQRRAKVEERKQQTIAENIIVSYADSIKQKPEFFYKDLSIKILKNYSSIYSAFEDVVENDAKLIDLEIEKTIAEGLEKLIRERIKPKQVSIEGIVTIHSYEENGVDLIVKAMDKAMKVSEKLSLKVLGAGNYEINIIAPDYQEAEEILEECLETIKISLAETNTEVEFKRK